MLFHGQQQRLAVSSVFRQYNRLRSLIKDPRHDCVLFSNEFQEHCYCPREKGERLEKWQSRWVEVVLLDATPRNGRMDRSIDGWMVECWRDGWVDG